MAFLQWAGVISKQLACRGRGVQMVLRLFGIALASSLGLMVLVGLTGSLASTAAEPVSMANRVDLATRYPQSEAAAGGVFTVCLPVVMRDYDPVPPLFSVLMYGSIDASTGFTRVVEAGARWIRFPVEWAGVEPVKGSYNWDSLDASIQTMVVSDVHPIATILSNPDWAAARPNGPVTNTADLQEFVGAAVARYPQVTYWEFYNEPDGKKSFGLNGAGYAAVLQAIYPAVKSANPDAKVVLGGLALDWFMQDGGGGPFDKDFLPTVLSHCASPCFDVANFHYYPAFRPVWEPYGHDIIGKATYVRQVLTAYGYNRPVINTEVGWPSASTWGSPELEARYVPKAYVRGFAAGLPVVSWYALVDTDSSNPGLLGPGLTPRSAFTAYKTLTFLLVGARYVRAIPPSETGSARIEGYEFSVPGLGGRKRVDAYWYDCPSMSDSSLYVNGLPVDCSTTAPLTVNAAQIAQIDKLGAKVILNDGNDGWLDGWVNIPGGVGSSPIYIDYAP